MLEGRQRPGQRRDHRGQHEDRRLVAVDRIALELRAKRVLADRHEDMPERRPGHADQQPERQEGDDGREVIVGQVTRQIDRQQRRAVEAGQPVLASRDGSPAECDREGQRAKRQRHQGEVDTSAPQDQKTYGEGKDADHSNGRQDRKDHLPRKEVPLRQGSGIASDPEPCGMAEGNQACVAHHHVQPERRDGQGDDLRCRRGRQPHQRQDPRQDQEDDGGDQKGAVLVLHRLRSRTSRWTRPEVRAAAAEGPGTSGRTSRPRRPRAGSGR